MGQALGARIFIISNLYPPDVSGGFEIECAQVAGALQKKGHDIHILTSGRLETPPIHRRLQLYAPFDQPITHLNRFNARRLLKVNKEITKKAIAEIKPDVIFHWSTLRIGLGPALAAQEMKVPIVWRLGDMNIGSYVAAPFSMHPRRLVGWSLDKLIYPQDLIHQIDFTHTSCITEHLKQDLISHGVPLDHAKVHHRGLPLKLFPIKKDPGSLSSPPKILYVGRLHPDKGVDQLLVVAKELGLQTTIVGTGDPTYVSMLKGIDPRAVFKGFIPYEQLSPIYQSHDLFVFPTVSFEGQGSTYLEAMASGVPVIASNHQGHGEVLRKSEAALLYPKDDLKALKLCIENLVQNGDLRKKLAQDGRTFVETYFNFDHYVDNLETFLVQACQNRSK